MMEPKSKNVNILNIVFFTMSLILLFT